MDLNDLAKAAPALATIATALVTLSGLLLTPGHRRRILKADAEIASALPPESEARKRLLEHLDNQVRQLIEDQTEKTRDWPMFFAAIIALPALAGVTIWLLQRDELWAYGVAIATGFLALVFLYGIFETGTPAKRDERGNRVDGE